MDADSFYKIGKIIKAHGVKGEAVIQLEADDPYQYEELESVFVEINKKPVPFFIENISVGKNSRAIVKFEDVDKEADLKELLNAALLLPLGEKKEEEEDISFRQLIGFNISDKNQGVLGTVIEFYELPGQDLLAMDYQGREILIPLHEDFILKADHKKKILHVHLPEGLLDLNI